jgi:large repetitive protein
LGEASFEDSSVVIVLDSAMRQNGVAENNIFASGTIIPILLTQDYETMPKIDISEIGFAHRRFLQSGAIEVSASQVGFGQGSLNHIGISQVSSTQINPNHDGITHTSSFQVGSTEIGILQSGAIQIGSAQISPAQVSSAQISQEQISPTEINLSQISLQQVSSSQIGSSEVSFSSSISSEQFSFIHNFSPTAVYAINNTALALWNKYTQPTTPFNFNLVIKDLSTGQLAEAQIIQFSNNGTPTGGILYLDIDANGFGWFIDTTPWENSEFNQTLTTLLHETAYLQGFVVGYSN